VQVVVGEDLPGARRAQGLAHGKIVLSLFARGYGATCGAGDILWSMPVFATFVTTEGTFKARLFDLEAPKTVENFVGLAEGTKDWTDPRSNQKVRQPYYDGVIFHRVIDGFMIQGGDPLGQGIGGPGYTFADEFHPKARHNKAGMLSMANRGPNTNGGQFFITLGPTPHLDDRHSVFGEVVEGMDVVKKIGSTPTGDRDRPLKDVIIDSIKIEKT
jgi:peptidyl-prolyl cis-trans isomerase A (cyclophilin A)